MISLSNRIENIVGKGGHAGHQQFSHFPKVLSKAIYFSFWVIKKNGLKVKSNC